MDPYTPPEAELVSADTRAVRRSVAWKLYFVMYTLLTLVSYPLTFLDPMSGAVEYVSLGLSAISVLGLFGYAFSRRYFTQSAWRTFFYVSLLFLVAYYYLTDMDLKNGLTDSEYYVSNIIGWLIVAPSLYALYAYSRPTYPLWMPPLASSTR